MIFENIKINDYIGYPNFPHQICLVLEVRADLIVVEVQSYIDNSGNKLIGVITKNKFKRLGLDLLNIYDAEVEVKELPL
jgi:hypothetical protein